MARIHSYVVRYDSGFAPNPFYGHCTLVTCKPGIRRSAEVGDWVIGSGSNAQGVGRGGHLVYGMRVTEVMTLDEYALNPRFESKNLFATEAGSKVVETTSTLEMGLRQLGSNEILFTPGKTEHLILSTYSATLE